MRLSWALLSSPFTPLQSPFASTPPSSGLAHRDGCLPCGFFPFDVFPASGSYLFLEGTSLQVRALSAFLTLSGLSSARGLPALFHAGPALGVFPFRVVFTRRAALPLGRSCPPEVGWYRRFRLDGRASSGPGVPESRIGRLSRRRRVSIPAPLQGFAPCECPCLRADCLGLPGDCNPRGLLLPRGFSLFAGDPPRVHPLSGFSLRCAC